MSRQSFSSLSLSPLRCNFYLVYTKILPQIWNDAKCVKFPKFCIGPKWPMIIRMTMQCHPRLLSHFRSSRASFTQSVTLPSVQCTKLTSITRPTDLIWQCSRQVPLEVCKAFCPLLHQETTEMSPRNLQETSDHRKWHSRHLYDFFL